MRQKAASSLTLQQCRKYGISYRELQEMLAERGVNVDHSTIYRWVQRYAPEMEKRLR
ncbi:hypothetical protein AB0185_29830, partial [Klebsiella pneumoniae]